MWCLLLPAYEGQGVVSATACMRARIYWDAGLGSTYWFGCLVRCLLLQGVVVLMYRRRHY